ncbi:hypothetical protein CBA19CS11_22485 [Caballeronia novacaledonica]|uniref:hypothetical protein n=1 Tax=Caballeronia novacaledonica TaxID=1544861 RepID=UPI001EE266DE|nr:hypothetical protein [Caballeronia novacaledonica]GJH11657.1 hypothetical protein CBA19CS11_22485 [Caballeronia novacaledonica]
MYLTSSQRSALMKTIAREQDDRERIAAIDAVVAQLRIDNPAAFHTIASLEQRVFFHEPGSDIPYLAAIKPKVPAPR